MKFTLPVLLVALMVTTGTVCASDVNLTADEKVEWHQKEQKIVAVGNAVATRDDMNIRADRMIGYYASRADKPQGKSRITKVEARGNVVMKSPKANAYGQSMDYDLQQDTIILKGSPAKISTDKEVITAEDNITYYPQEQKAVAFGNVVGTSQGNKVFADKMVAFFTKENAKSSNLVMRKVQIFGHVKITTSNAEVTAERGVYYPQEGKVRLDDNIVINQNGNTLKGDKAETNLNTGISKLISTSKTGRVKGVFKEKKAPNEK